ncbi:uncharacterized protein LOC104585165 [Brachypodium distachyon]|uniref:DUF4220 domain-containing protein n=1 Tax=Brachypodium distachyon TaxID=15368 RepID=A0A0Q3J0T8_BRADI|nr:uncharacterized protein LOC104585165 [Brachypodium distachyon]KQJ91960.1 hypothetical protein BRADI_4g40840v3 [Brachypodium distachyon]|eukprot:XP_010239478.1 uncharacterized protein LOC104585165 [Brachypodium distachyon]
MQQQHLSVGNLTREATALAASPVGRLARIELLVTISCALLTVLVLLGSGRRATQSSALRFAVWAALMLSYPAVSYTIGLMQSASFRNELVVTWGCFLLLLLGTADGIAAYSLNDSDQQARTILNQALQVIYVFLLLLSYLGSLPLHLKAFLSLLLLLSVAKLGMRVTCFLRDGRDRVLTVDNKLVSDYMAREHGYSGADYDAGSMKGYKYVVAGEAAELHDGERDYWAIDPETNPDLVTVDRVWECQGRLLRSGPDADQDDDDDAAMAALELKDLCLSFALFKLLRRRLGRYPLHESGLNKTRDLVKVGLLAGEDHERMYRVVEVELGFLFDFYYARYRSPKETLMPDTALFAAVVATSLCTLFATAPDYYRRSPAPPQGYPNNIIVTTMFDIWLTRVIILLFLVLESFQYLALVFSDWHKVKTLCRYVLNEAWHNSPLLERTLRLICRVKLTRYWNGSLGQHSLLHACLVRHDKPPRVLRFLTSGRRTATADRRKLPGSVKRAIYGFLRTGLTRIQNGEHTLEKNGMLDNFYWAIAQESAVQTMMIWHVATAICDSRMRLSCRADAATKENHEVATTLSAYCAYLMASAPELLPDHSYDTQLLFQGVRRKAKKLLRGCRLKEDMHGKLPDSECNDGYEGVLADGKKLSDEIVHKMPDTAMRWRVLAELWVEMLLSVAPSDNATGHIQKLATGGELITHLWALLTHAGILEKPISRYQRKGP